MTNTHREAKTWEWFFKQMWFTIGWRDCMEGKPLRDLDDKESMSQYEIGRLLAAAAKAEGINEPRFGMVHLDRVYDVLDKCQQDPQGIK